MDPVLELATYDDLLALPEGVKGEVVHGTLVVQPAPSAGGALPASGAPGPHPSRRQRPDLPPSFSSSITASTVIPRSIALHMS